MKPIKLTKKMLSMHPADLLVNLGAVYENMSYPQHIYFSKEDYGALRKSLYKKAKKEYPCITNKSLQFTVEMDLLSYGPNETLADALKPGYALIDKNSIESEIDNAVD